MQLADETRTARPESRPAGKTATTRRPVCTSSLRSPGPCDDSPRTSRRAREVQMQIDELLEGAVAGGVVPGIVAVIGNRDGVVVEADAGESGPDTVFRIASMTKAMTSVAALQLVERGEL